MIEIKRSLKCAHREFSFVDIYGVGVPEKKNKKLAVCRDCQRKFWTKRRKHKKDFFLYSIKISKISFVGVGK